MSATVWRGVGPLDGEVAAFVSRGLLAWCLLACAPVQRPVADVGPDHPLVVDSLHSYIRFGAHRSGARHLGEVRRFSGAITLEREGLAGSRIVVDLDMRSVATDVPALTTHLRSADFFDVERHPNAVFASTTIAPGRAEGTLELRGRRQVLQFPVDIELRDDRVTASGSFVLDRRAFGIVHPGLPWDPASPEVAISFHIEAAR
jgi:polyisoprenoid-binding protein YceI